MTETRFDVSYLVSNGRGCGFMESKTFIGKALEDVKDFIKNVKDEYAGCTITFRVYEGWGMNQHRIEI